MKKHRKYCLGYKFSDQKSFEQIVPLLIILISGSFFSVYSLINSKYDISISYFGRTITHPGLKISVSDELIRSCEQIFCMPLQVSGGFYYHRSNQTAIFLTYDIAPSLNFGKKLKWSVAIPVGLGYMRTFIDGKVYTIDDNGAIKRKYFAGSNFFMPFSGLTIGRKVNNSRFSRFFISLGAFGQYPFNSYMLPNIYFEIGLTLNKGLSK